MLLLDIEMMATIITGMVEIATVLLKQDILVLLEVQLEQVFAMKYEETELFLFQQQVIVMMVTQLILMGETLNVQLRLDIHAL